MISCSKDWFLSVGRHLLLNILFQKKSKRCGEGVARGWGHTFWKKLGIFKFVTLPLEILEKEKLHLWTFHRVVWHTFFLTTARNSTSFLIDLGISTSFFFNTSRNSMSSTPPPPPLPLPHYLDFYWNSPMQTRSLRWNLQLIWNQN